ncbi:hypothetical protein ACUY29_08010, partial [Corynebacterium aurimucosum]
VFVEGHSITFELFGVPRHGGRLPFFPTQPGWISGVYLTGVRSFTYLQPPPTTIDPDNLAATTNSLEGGINAPIKELARRHRGLSLPHQRTVMDWWLYLHTEVPDDPVKIARDQRWGQDALSTATDMITHDTTATTNDIGAPAEYDTAIDTSYQHNLGIQKGWIK